MRPMLERIDFTVRHFAASVAGDLDELQKNKGLENVEYGQGPKELFGRSSDSKTNAQLLIPEFSYNIIDCCLDFKNNPGGVLEVGGSAEVDDYPLWEPKGSFPKASDPQGRVALIGHSGKYIIFYNNMHSNSILRYSCFFFF